MRTIKVVEEDNTRAIVDRTIYVVDSMTKCVEENELVNIVFLDGTHTIMKPVPPSRIIERCEHCCLGATGRCCAFKGDDGDYRCLFSGMPAEYIDSVLEEL